MSIGTRVIALLIAGAVLFAAIRIHKSSKRTAKHVGVVAAFIAGLSALGTVVGDWMTSQAWIGSVSIGGLIVAVAIIVVDWLVDRKPDKPAFWAAFVLPLLIVLGAANIGDVGDQISDGSKEVGSQISKVDDGGKTEAEGR